MIKDRADLEDYLVHFCRDYFATTGLPTSLRRKNIAVYSSQGESMKIDLNKEPGAYLYYAESNGPEFCAGTENIQYGRIPVEGTDYDIFLGPIFPSGITDDLIRGLMREQIIPIERREDLEEYLRHIPDITSFQLGRHMVMVNRIVNDEVLEVTDLFCMDFFERSEQLASSFTDSADADSFSGFDEEAPSTESITSSYNLEQQLYAIVKSGNEDVLQRFLFTYSPGIKMGRLASTQLRHYKNTFISDATKLVYRSAIPAGVAPKQAIELSNRYIRNVETLTTEGAIATSEYAMRKDFCRLCAAAAIPDHISSELTACITFIRNHVNENIQVADVAACIYRSPSYTMKLFRDELQITIGHFITRCKLEEARSLLTYTNMTLTEISNYLCFSSQSYFQNVFKRKYGVTPGQFRKSI